MNFRTLGFVRAVVCLVPALLAGCGGSGDFDIKRIAADLVDRGEQGFPVTGIASAGAPLVGVVVSATDKKGEVIQSTVTDATGRYSMKLKNQSSYVLTVPFNDIDGSPALLSSVYAFNGNFSDAATNTVQVNINPLTSLITSRVLGMIPTSALTNEQIKNAIINPATVANAEKEIATLFQPIYTALAIPASQTNDPIGTTEYQASINDPLDNLFTVARFKVRTNEVRIGTGIDRAVIPVPTNGTLPSSIPTASVNSLAALHAGTTRTPIKHVIVVVGENRAFDSVFATYQAPEGQTIKNLLSQGIINADGTPGPNFGLAKQNQATAPADQKYSISPIRSVAFAALPQPTQMGAYVLDPITLVKKMGGTPDPHFPNDLPSGPFQQTNYVPYGVPVLNPIGVTTADPPHRFFQMWQQTGGTNEKLDMYAWVAVTAGQGGDTEGVSPENPAQGGELMAFLNMQTGDIPEWKTLAETYAISDNYHQSILGGTGANFFAIATADVPYFNKNGAIAVPFATQIEDPNPMEGTANFYEQDGYQGGSYVNCSDAAQPGVAPILAALASANVHSKCEAGKYYLVNNYGLGYDMNGNEQPVGPNNFVLPPQTVPTIAEALAKKEVSWKWYTGARESADLTADLAVFGLPATPSNYAFGQGLQYHATGDALVASKNVMTSELKAGLAGLTTFYNDIKNNTLPAVSFVVPKNLDSGHPGYSVQAKYEHFTRDLIAQVKANPSLWANTAIIITTDEGGGYFDTGPIQMQDFFGDGPRVPFFVVSPYARKNHIDHIYHDHASLLKFIERNWKLAPLSARSRDNHPNPVQTKHQTGAEMAYIPINKTPTVGDLMTMFEF